MEHKRTFDEYLKRDMQLSFRVMKIQLMWDFMVQFEPFKSLFVRKRFNKTLALIHEMKVLNAKAGYWA